MDSIHLIPPPTTTTKRIRRKTREVSSRYMTTPASSPFVSSSSHNQKFRGTSSINSSSPESSDGESEFSNENLPLTSSQNLRTPSPFNTQIKALVTQKKAAVRLFADKNSSIKTRPGTPFSPKGSILSNTRVRNVRDNAKNRNVTSRVFSVKSDGHFSDNSSVVSDSDFGNLSFGKNSGFCDATVPINGSRVNENQDGFRNSVPETDKLPPISSRRIQIDRNENHIGNISMEGPACRRSLNLGVSINLQNMCQNKKGKDVPSKLCLPPLVPGEVKKGARWLRKQEDIHMLKLLDNRYLQWRFINAKAKAAFSSRTTEAEKSLFRVSDDIVERRDVVTEKRIEVARLKRMQCLSYVLESQLPLLNDYSNLEEDYSSSLSGVTNALNDCLVKLPTTENVKQADVNELKDVFQETTNVFNSLSPNIQICLPETNDIKDVASELAVIASIERALVEECGNLLIEAQNLQVTECSLRGQLIQAKLSRGL